MKLTEGSVTLSQKLDNSLTILPNPSTVLKSKAATMAIFNKVATHPDVFPQISSYKAALCGLQVLSQSKNSSINDLFAEFFNMFDLRQLIRTAASARDYGFAVMEVTDYTTINGRTVPIKVELCPQELFLFDRDRRLRLKSKTNKDGIDVMATYPNKFLLCQNEATLLNPYGTGLLDVGYWLAVGLNGNLEFMLQFAEDDGRDKWIGTYPKGATQEEINELLTTLMQLRNNGVAAYPEGMSAEPKPMSGRGSSNDLYKNIDEMLRRKIEKLWTGTDLTMQVAGKGGYSSSESGLTIREDALEDGKTLVLSAVKQIASMVVNLNRLPESPSLSVQLPRALSKTIAETDKIYFDMGLKPTKNLFLKRGYAEDDFFIEDIAKGPKTTDFAAVNPDYDMIASVFDGLAKTIKKKI